MTVLGALVAKDARRAARNPVPWLVSLAVPLVITALIGVAFGPRTGGGLGKIALALVDEDDSRLTRLLRDAVAGRETGEHLDVRVLGRAEAMRRITADEIAAVVVIPKGFTRDYLSGRAPVTFELVKNPARAIHPAVVEEALGLLAAALDAVARTLGDDLAAWGELLESRERFDFDAAARLLRTTGDRLAPARPWLDPPVVTYESETKPGEEEKGPAWSLFAFLLIGMAAMFLLYIADNAMRDLYRELRFHTIDRFRTLHEGMVAFVAGKAAFALVAVLVGAVILFGGGSLVFAFAWRRPVAFAVLVLAYALFAAGLMGVLAALGGSERRAEVLDNVIVMAVSLAGGCMFPPEQLPAFLREHVTPLLPTAWFVAAGRALQADPEYGGWVGAAAALAAAGVVLLGAASILLQRRLWKGAAA